MKKVITRVAISPSEFRLQINNNELLISLPWGYSMVVPPIIDNNIIDHLMKYKYVIGRVKFEPFKENITVSQYSVIYLNIDINEVVYNLITSIPNIEQKIVNMKDLCFIRHLKSSNYMKT